MPKQVNQENKVSDMNIGLKKHQKDYLRKESLNTGKSVSFITRNLVDEWMVNEESSE